MSIFSVIKNLPKIYKTLASSELYEKLANCQDKNRELTEEINKLKEGLKDKTTFKYENNAYYEIEPISGKKAGGPFCSRCYDYEGKKIHLIIVLNSYICPKCRIYI